MTPNSQAPAFPDDPNERLRAQSGDLLKTMAGTTVRLPFALEHSCFGNRQGWCENRAKWRMETPQLLLHWCDACKLRSDFGNATWTKLPEKPISE